MARSLFVIVLGIFALVVSALALGDVRTSAQLGIGSTALAAPPGCKQNPDGTLECKKSKPNLRQGKSVSPPSPRKGTNLNSSRSN